MDLQHMIDGWNAAEQKVRSGSQMTLGELIETLESMSSDIIIQGIGDPHSYRGYYCDLAFRPKNHKVTSGGLLKDCRSVMGRTLTGYKGGEFLMGESTPVWIAHYGELGEKIVGFDANESVFITEDDG